MKKIPVYYFLLVFFISPLSIFAQIPSWSLAVNTVGDTSRSGGITSDKNGNVYITGFFRNSLQLGNVTLHSAGEDYWGLEQGGDIFIAKYTPDGNIVWAKSAGGKHTDLSTDIKTDSFGNIYIAGFFRDTAYFDTAKLVSDGDDDIFLAKYDSSGNAIWAKRAGGLYKDRVSFYNGGLAIDNANNIYITGQFANYPASPPVYGTANFGNIILTAPSQTGIFLAKYNLNGDVVWAKSAGDAGVESADIAFDVSTDKEGNSFIVGDYDHLSYFDNLALQSVSSGFVIGNMFIAQYDSTGNAVWAKTAGGINPNSGPSSSPGSVDGTQSVADDLGNVYVSGTFGGCNLKIEGWQFSGIDYPNAYMAKYNSVGTLLWARTFFNVGALNGLYYDQSGIYLTGSYSNLAVFGTDTVHSNGQNMFVVKYDDTGNEIWEMQPDLINGTAMGYDITSYNNDLYVTGAYGGMVQFGNYTLQSGTGTDMFVARLSNITGIATINNLQAAITVYPNPASAQLFIKGDLKDYNKLLIYDMMGRLVGNWQLMINSKEKTINTSPLANGIYQLRLIGDNAMQTKTFAIEK